MVAPSCSTVWSPGSGASAALTAKVGSGASSEVMRRPAVSARPGWEVMSLTMVLAFSVRVSMTRLPIGVQVPSTLALVGPPRKSTRPVRRVRTGSRTIGRGHASAARGVLRTVGPGHRDDLRGQAPLVASEPGDRTQVLHGRVTVDEGVVEDGDGHDPAQHERGVAELVRGASGALQRRRRVDHAGRG